MEPRLRGIKYDADPMPWTDTPLGGEGASARLARKQATKRCAAIPTPSQLPLSMVQWNDADLQWPQLQPKFLYAPLSLFKGIGAPHAIGSKF